MKDLWRRIIGRSVDSHVVNIATEAGRVIEVKRIIEAMKLVEGFLYSNNIGYTGMGEVLRLVRTQYMGLEEAQGAVTLDKILRIGKTPAWYKLPPGRPRLEKCYFGYIHCDEHDNDSSRKNHDPFLFTENSQLCGCIVGVLHTTDADMCYVSLRNATDNHMEEQANAGHLLRFAERYPHFQRFDDICVADGDKIYILRGASDRGMYVVPKTGRSLANKMILVMSKNPPKDSIIFD